jgi:multiple sugar transport system substrate-binding protein
MILTMMIQKHKIIGFAVILFLGMMLSACGEAPTVEPVSIEFTFPNEDVDFYTGLVNEFQKKHPNTTIHLNPVTGAGFRAIQPGDSDAFAVNTGRMKEYLDQGGLLALDPFIQTDRSFASNDYYHGTLDLLEVNGQTWAVPLGVDMFVLFYNKDRFEQAGLEDPQEGWTWDDFLNAAILLNKPDDPDHPVYGYTTTPGFSDTLAFVYAHGGHPNHFYGSGCH